MAKYTVVIASDHAGFHLKMVLLAELNTLGYLVTDLGTDSEASADYPDFGFAVAHAVNNKEADIGVLICGTGIGISIAANRHPGIRAALVHDSLGARMSRLHNNANVICFGGRMIGEEIAKDCLTTFLETEFEGGRHASRVTKLSQVLSNTKTNSNIRT